MTAKRFMANMIVKLIMLYGNSPLNVSFVLSTFKSNRYGKMALFRWRLVGYVFTWARYITQWSDFDINADYICAHCGGPTFRFVETCSEECRVGFMKQLYDWERINCSHPVE
jgi:hypothetical protein